MSIIDPLARLLNRRWFEDILDSEFKKVSRYTTPLGRIMVNIDHFKNVNDTYGRDTAEDIVIRETAQVIKKNIINVDTSCRWVCEDFIALTPMTEKAFTI